LPVRNDADRVVSPENGTGNTSGNIIIGNSAANVLNGLNGFDTMSGKGGDDTYVVDSTGDVVLESANEGTDLVQSSVTFTLGEHIENLTLTGFSIINGTGNAASNSITGNSRDNVLRGEGGDDSINGGSGNDTMYGGQGNDTYTVAQAGDIVSEEADAGIDLVRTSVTFTLGNNVENLTITSSGTVNGFGNSLANTLIGGSGANRLEGLGGNDFLDGGSGSDTMLGGTGDDIYVVGVSSDVVTESAGEGIDTVQSSITYTLGNDVENLTLTGTAATGTGNGLDNVLIGNGSNNTLNGGGGNDTLDGGSGSDTMNGNAGNDTYFVGAGDTVNESAGNGIDTVKSSMNYTLSTTQELENLTLIGTGNFTGTGNALANQITGNTGNNTLTGNNGADAYIYTAGGGVDTINNSSTDAAQDRLNFTDLARADLTFSRPAMTC
jgi:trimeric autotransporter adhesin